jgi:hypothetical protein
MRSEASPARSAQAFLLAAVVAFVGCALLLEAGRSLPALTGGATAGGQQGMLLLAVVILLALGGLLMLLLAGKELLDQRRRSRGGGRPHSDAAGLR